MDKILRTQVLALVMICLFLMNTGCASKSETSEEPQVHETAYAEEEHEEVFDHYEEEEAVDYGNGIFNPVDNPLSTFSVDVDTAGYSVVRHAINSGRIPSREEIRIEELVNYFPYSYEDDFVSGIPFTVISELGPCPWDEEAVIASVVVNGEKILANENIGLCIIIITRIPNL